MLKLTTEYLMDFVFRVRYCQFKKIKKEAMPKKSPWECDKLWLQECILKNLISLKEEQETITKKQVFFIEKIMTSTIWENRHITPIDFRKKEH